MGILDLSADAADLSASDSIKALPRSLGERVEASTAAIFAPDRYFNIAGARQEGWQRAVDELHTVTGQKYLNPYAAVTTEEAMSPDFQPGQIVQQRQNKIIEAARMARAQGNEDLFDPENIDRYIAEEATRRREREASFVDTGNGIGNFIASAAVSMAEPINFITLFGPAARLPSLAAMRTGETFLRNVGREALLQAGVNTAAQALTEALDYRGRAPLGTEQTAGEVAGNLAGAAVFGAALGGGTRALHLKWLSLSDKTRLDAPVEVRDAFRVIEADALYSGQNRLGVDPLLHERYEGRSFDAILRGRPVDLADLSRTADTPLTALGTILRSEPGTIRADISGLGNTVDRVRALPDTEIEAVLREARPDAFKQIDDIARRAAELDARVSQINSELDQIGLPDVVDLDTAARLQDIETQLAKKGLRRQVRQDLEREREMITQSVDPQGRLAEELKALRADFFPEQQKALKEIADAREALAREREAAQSVVTREIEQMRNRLGSMDFGRAFADEMPADVLAREFGSFGPTGLAEAIQRADMMRQVRVFRDVMGEPGSVGFSRSTEAMPSRATETLTPEQVKALDVETARLMENEATASREVSINGRTMSAREAMEDADRMAKDAQAALGCAMGAL
jgi:hypothetical protein